jgi:methionyl-tRNA formyltransferase
LHSSGQARTISRSQRGCTASIRSHTSRSSRRRRPRDASRSCRASPRARTPSSRHLDVNAASVAALIAREAPDLVVVSGTNLLRAPLIEQIAGRARIMNLHTGISPYLKGGPNCTNWALALDRLELIGSTIMWLDRGIDTGAIVATEQAPLDGRESLRALHLRVMEHAHDLYTRCYARAVAGDALPAVPQTAIGEGMLLRSRDWDTTQMLRALANFYRRYRPDTVGGDGVTLVSPERGMHAV